MVPDALSAFCEAGQRTNPLRVLSSRLVGSYQPLGYQFNGTIRMGGPLTLTPSQYYSFGWGDYNAYEMFVDWVNMQYGGKESSGCNDHCIRT
jgi:hypothetical protein